MHNQSDILIIGGGVIGVCTAYFLAKAGASVTLVEKEDIAAGSSYGNAGLICPSHSTPIAAPGVLTQGLKWLLDPESPFYIKPRLDPALISWLWRFRSYCNEEPFHSAIPVLRDMHRASLALYQEVVVQESLDCFFEQVGGLAIFLTPKGFEKSQYMVEEMQEHGLLMERLDANAVRAKEPAVHPNVVGGILYPEDGHIDPALFVRGLAARAIDHGARLHTETTVLGFETANQCITAVETTKGTIQTKEVVLAAGAWSTGIVQDLQLELPMQPAKGYSITIERAENSPRIPLNLGEAKVAVTPMGPHLRFAGTLELAGFDFSINQRRVNAILRAADSYMVDMGERKTVEVWRGMRPCAPDGLPYIGRSHLFENLIVATGHSYLGLSMGPATGKLVQQLIYQEEPIVGLDAMKVERFG